MPTLQRSVSIRGARFYREGDDVLFVHHLDASTREGPRAATDEVSVRSPRSTSAWVVTYPPEQVSVSPGVSDADGQEMFAAARWSSFTAMLWSATVPVLVTT